MIKKFVYIVSLALILFVSGCSTPALDIDDRYGITDEKIAQINEGETTKEQIEELFGTAEMEVLTADGTTYFFKDLNLNTLWVIYNEDSTVAEFEWSN